MKLPKYLLCSLKDSYHFPIHYWQEMKKYCSRISKLDRFISKRHTRTLIKQSNTERSCQVCDQTLLSECRHGRGWIEIAQITFELVNCNSGVPEFWTVTFIYMSNFCQWGMDARRERWATRSVSSVASSWMSWWCLGSPLAPLPGLVVTLAASTKRYSCWWRRGAQEVGTQHISLTDAKEAYPQSTARNAIRWRSKVW